MAFGKQDKDPKPAEARKCPFFHIGGSAASPCVQTNCAMWHEDVGACAFNMIAKAVQSRG